ncbi:hypothetical protein Kpol_392p3 [Vanderwaltozyma polyspora DSM 70294]|uniref:Ribosomal protein n=1 Tax=Vanderwaltozyma polyspora (strain ATCC 22028 / DSM 70294 / BCRC 21397 / CBS 2163 / NBRC 10782 / NRRL Y-8283 / UCD 57-17) TaxID=436907 RepID=A7TRR4_VANPO|nr:uncharacterized protein Kpol_392p3 [Vanderwaltozyma polyspora DSM 70294]EDO15036.1 hypothetical protein Kpol_392p3 [Vanderwaltozyma polyspora DSM 70294]
MLSRSFGILSRRCEYHSGRVLLAEAVAASETASAKPVSKSVKDKLKRRELRRHSKRKADARKPASSYPLYMPISQALRYLRAAEVGQPISQQIITITTDVVSERGNLNLNGNISYNTPIKDVKIAVFSNDPEKLAKIKEEHNCHLIGGTDLVEKIKSGKQPVDFDKAFATPDISPMLTSQLARVLGPRGVLPTIKKGTVSEDVSSLIKGSIGLMPFRQTGNSISVSVGRCNFSDKQILENIIAVRSAYNTTLSSQKSKKPSLLGKTTITSTHGPGITIDFA